ncbi:hypothetical protein APP90_23465 [Salmonella enterica subsp. enterica serovar Sandiego]|nr:hypothetical protein APP90_23465 [Salmonella enterica subsp. enterica serovar Sandiego]
MGYLRGGGVIPAVYPVNEKYTIHSIRYNTNNTVQYAQYIQYGQYIHLLSFSAEIRKLAEQDLLS